MKHSPLPLNTLVRKMGSVIGFSKPLVVCLLATASSLPADPTFPTPPAQPAAETTAAIQVTEMGRMRTLLVLDESVDGTLGKLARQRLSDVHFRLFDADQSTKGGRLGADALKALADKEGADMLVHVSAAPREKKAMGDFKLFECEATTDFYSAITGELVATHTSRMTGERNSDEVAAKRSATEKAVDASVKEATTKALEKANKIMIYEAVIHRVPNNTEALKIIAHINKLQGVQFVRQRSYDPATRLLTVEVAGSPKMLTFIRAHIEAMPRGQ